MECLRGNLPAPFDCFLIFPGSGGLKTTFPFNKFIVITVLQQLTSSVGNVQKACEYYNSFYTISSRMKPQLRKNALHLYDNLINGTLIRLIPFAPVIVSFFNYYFMQKEKIIEKKNGIRIYVLWEASRGNCMGNLVENTIKENKDVVLPLFCIIHTYIHIICIFIYIIICWEKLHV